jgi:DNA-damage-inducible protein J
MGANVVVRARIDERVKAEASAVLKAVGLTPSDAFRMLMIRIARERALPSELLSPNETTIAAMRDARAGKVTSVDSIDALEDEAWLYENEDALAAVRRGLAQAGQGQVSRDGPNLEELQATVNRLSDDEE